MADHLCRKRLHHLDGVCAHAVAIMKARGHAENDDVVFLLRPAHIGAPVRDFPGERLHLFCPTGKDSNLPALRVEHRVTAKEFFAHLLFHVHALLVKLVAHAAVVGNGHKVALMHYLRHMVGGDAAPMGNPRSAMLVSAGVAAVGIALRVADEDGNVGIKDIICS